MPLASPEPLIGYDAATRPSFWTLMNRVDLSPRLTVTSRISPAPVELYTLLPTNGPVADPPTAMSGWRSACAARNDASESPPAVVKLPPTKTLPPKAETAVADPT